MWIAGSFTMLQLVLVAGVAIGFEPEGYLFMTLIPGSFLLGFCIGWPVETLRDKLQLADRPGLVLGGIAAAVIVTVLVVLYALTAGPITASEACCWPR